ncbi:hypothetical protein RRG08_007946 [Elysia crispata]|uniref:Uncharacterized protein n=1 Tax=Elysia crispata TaxID=231223 RepID=A0AAE1DL67_9GAST|nr:hypothetical protein RRG08_007946 [Elysia crispata]
MRSRTLILRCDSIPVVPVTGERATDGTLRVRQGRNSNSLTSELGGCKVGEQERSADDLERALTCASCQDGWRDSVDHVVTIHADRKPSAPPCGAGLGGGKTRRSDISLNSRTISGRGIEHLTSIVSWFKPVDEFFSHLDGQTSGILEEHVNGLTDSGISPLGAPRAGNHHHQPSHTIRGRCCGVPMTRD